VFRGKTVLLPCDDPEWSNFTKYFAQNFEKLDDDSGNSPLSIIEIPHLRVAVGCC
jgi:hypothetical protein